MLSLLDVGAAEFIVDREIDSLNRCAETSFSGKHSSQISAPHVCHYSHQSFQLPQVTYPTPSLLPSDLRITYSSILRVESLVVISHLIIRVLLITVNACSPPSRS